MNPGEKQIEHYIDQVCEVIKYKGVHAEIADELRNHIEEMKEGFIMDGIPENEAISKAIHQMGDPHILGKQFRQTYKPRTEWSLLGFVITFIGIGLFVMYSIEHSNSITIPETSLFLNKTLATSLGITLAVFLFFYDYQKLKKYSYHLYFITLIIMIYTLFMDDQINGRPMSKIGPISTDFFNLSPYLFVIALGGIISSWDWNQPRVHFKICSLVIVPSIFYLISSSAFSHFIFIMCFLVILISSKAIRRQKVHIFSLLSVFFGMGVLLNIMHQPYHWRRISIFLDPYKDPLMSGWHYIQSIEAIRSAGLWGQGLTSAYKTLPYSYSDFVFTYFIYAFGWVAGLALFGLAILFILRLGTISNQLRDFFGSLVIKGMVTIFSIKFLWHMLMSFSLVPVIGVSLPFISHGGAEFVIQMMAVGIVLSIYRRRDLIKTSSSGI